MVAESVATALGAADHSRLPRPGSSRNGCRKIGDDLLGCMGFRRNDDNVGGGQRRLQLCGRSEGCDPSAEIFVGCS